MKICFFDKRLLRQYYAFLGAISVFTSIIFLFVDIDKDYKVWIGGITLIVLMSIYIAIWIYQNKRQYVRLKINNSEIEVKFGDIFKETADLKVVAFNEYFDTQVDNIVISATSLHGQYIEKFHKNRVEDLDSLMSVDSHLAGNQIGEDVNRVLGKKIIYKLGTIIPINDYLLVAFSHFDKANKAYLEINDYIGCLLNFWNEVDRIYSGRTVALPILGSGITRFKGYENISDQELLELIIWTFKVSRIKFTYPAKVKIIVFEKKSERINLLKLKDLES